MKLWQKETSKLNTLIESFETKDDLLCDQKLVQYDIQGSLAHANMLYKIGILTKQELTQLEKGLQEIATLANTEKFTLTLGDEDIHTKIENYLTEKYGTVGKKIHTGRSRNDQVLTALRLYSKKEVTYIMQEATLLINTFSAFKKDYGKIPMPGYTHMQKAMPSSLGLWADSFIASLTDDVSVIQNAYHLIDQSPLGSAAGYGLPIKNDRAYTAKQLHFKKVQKNPIYCQQSRGKFEGVVIASLVNILLTINKFASDMLLFTTQEFNFFTVTAEITTGSSIMPQKKNLDLAELLRSKVHLVLGNYMQIVSLSANLISGFNRDLQDSKKPFMESVETTKESIAVTTLLLKGITPNTKQLQAAMTPELYATEKVLQLVEKGESFRTAYQQVGKEYAK